MAALREDLETTRAGFREECEFLHFIIDSYTGCGGYTGRIKQPASGYWGAAASAYSQYASTILSDAEYDDRESNSYLDRFPREDLNKYLRRVNVAHYLNYCAPITNLKVSYLVRKPHKLQNPPKKLADWIERTGYNDGYRERVTKACVLGWFPAVVDMPAVPRGVETLAQAEEQVGALDPYVVSLLPNNLLDYSLDEHGEFIWAKVAQVSEVKENWRSEAKKVVRYTIWTREAFAVYEVVGDATPSEAPVKGGPHPFGRVPVVSWRAGTSIKDDVKARSTIGDIALECRRLFNLISELDEHIRSQVFAILLVPTKEGGTGNEKATVGNKAGMRVDAEQKNLPQYLAPPATVAATLETRVEKSVIEIYRMARVEYDRASGTNSSAQSKQANFEQTNADLCDIAAALAQDDYRTLCVVGAALGCTPEELDAMACVPEKSFATEDLSLELEQAVEAITQLPMIGLTFKAELLKRLARQMLPNMTAELQETVDDEIDRAVEQAEKDAEAAKASLTEGVTEQGDIPPGDEEGKTGEGVEDDEEAA